MSPNIPERFHRQLLTEVSRRPGVRRVILYGSRARGDHQPHADIDLAIEAPTLQTGEWLDLQEALSHEAQTLLEVDVVRLEHSAPELRREILKEGKLVYEQASR